MNPLQFWCDDILARTAVPFPAEKSVTGEHFANLGPRSEFARVEMRFLPASAFVAKFDQLPDSLAVRRFAKHAVFGVLDVLLTQERHPMTGLELVVRAIDVDEVRSTELAFRLAGRHAARQALGKETPKL